MKILLVNPNNESLPLYTFPIGLLSITSEIPNKHIISICDLCFSNNYRMDIKKAIKKSSPDLVGISIRNITSGVPLIYRNYIAHHKKLVRIIKENTASPIVLGGPGFSLYPDKLLKKLNVKYGIIGEGELAIKEFIEFLEGERALEKVSSLIIKKNNNNFVVNKKKIIKNLNSLLFPRTDLFDFSKYRKHGVPINIQTKRGCIFRCIYCNYPKIEGNIYRLKTTEKVIKEIKLLKKKFKSDFFYFSDSVFTYPVNHAKSILKAIISNNIKIKWFAYSNPRGIDKNFAKLMKQSGCIGLELGIDSLSDKTLISYQKDFTVDEIKRAINILDEESIPLTLDIIAGGPGDSMSTCNETLDNLRQDNPKHEIYINYGMQVFYGTPLQRKFKIDAENINFKKPPKYLTNDIFKNIIKINNNFKSLQYRSIISTLDIHNDNKKNKLFILRRKLISNFTHLIAYFFR